MPATKMDLNQLSQDYQVIEKALVFLESEYKGQPTLEEVARSVGYSPHHFQRIFTKWVGISPKRFLQFILNIVPYKDEKIQIMYGIHGQKLLIEKELGWLSGYEDSRPVRIGNAAYKQKQNDMYGIVMDVIYQSLCMFGPSLDYR